MAHEQSTLEFDLIGRRQALSTLAGVATAVAGVGLIGMGTAKAAAPARAAVGHHDDALVSAEEPARSAEDEAALARDRALVAALVPADLDMGRWQIAQVHVPRFGALAVVLRTPQGDFFQVDVLRRDPKLAGIADTEHFSLFIANAGDGKATTDEWQARGAKVLAHHLRRTERSGTPLPQLLSFRERASRHPDDSYSVLG